MRLLAAIHPGAAASPAGGSLAGWVWLAIVFAVVVAGGLLIASRR